MYPVNVGVVSTIVFSLIYIVSKQFTKNTKISAGHASICHALTIVPLTGVALIEYFEDGIINTKLLEKMAGISTGYYIMDSFNLLLSKEFKPAERIAYSIHHGLAFLMVYMITHSWLECELITLVTLTAELSTLFVNFHQQISHFAKDQHRLRFVNGLFMIATFILTRFVFIPAAYYYDMNCIFGSWKNIIVVNMVHVPFLLLNSYWLKLMVAGLIKVVKDKKY